MTELRRSAASGRPATASRTAATATTPAASPPEAAPLPETAASAETAAPPKTAPLPPIVAELAQRFRAWDGDAEMAEFNELALRVHDAQRRSNPVLRRYWADAGIGDPRRWEAIPPVPTAAFRDAAIVSGKAEAVFRTSGTSSGGARRGEHHVASLALYRAAAREPYRRSLFSGLKRVRVVSLLPHPRAVPDSSLSAMAGFIADEQEVAEAAWAFDPDRGVDEAVVRRAAESAREPVLLLTTAFALVQLLEALDERPIQLPPNSRVMETGGFKGRTAEVDRGTLYDRVARRLDVPESNIVNEYGMTELLSQAYDNMAGADGGAPESDGGARESDGLAKSDAAIAIDAAARGLPPPPLSQRVHRFPPWVRTRALDPATLAPLPPGEPGLLAHFDLANAASVCHVLTEDVGKTVAGGGFRLLGRARGAQPRGCSLTAEAFLRAVRAHS